MNDKQGIGILSCLNKIIKQYYKLEDLCHTTLPEIKVKSVLQCVSTWLTVHRYK